jgi:hypothetical protein
MKIQIGDVLEVDWVHVSMIEDSVYQTMVVDIEDDLVVTMDMDGKLETNRLNEKGEIMPDFLERYHVVGSLPWCPFRKVG